MPPDHSFLSLWEEMRVPAEGTMWTRRVGDTNVLLSKDSAGTFGIVMHNVRDSFHNPRLSNLSFSTPERMNLRMVGGREETVRNCLILNASSVLDPIMLSLVMEHLIEVNDTTEYTAEDLSRTIDEVMLLARRDSLPPTREEIVGAWGEIYLMSSLLRACHSHESQMAVISGWEGEGHRERVDFRFPHCGSSIEVKTCSDGLRVHHIGGSDQLEPPDGCDRGFLGSLSVVEDEYGKTCSMLLSDAKRGLLGTLDERSLASEHIDRRARTRGAECQDESLFIWLEDDSDEFRLYPFGSVPRPTWDDTVEDVEWSADLTRAEFLGDDDRDEEIGRIAG
jgi:hypothetical protein